jgi:hypothetical protein
MTKLEGPIKIVCEASDMRTRPSVTLLLSLLRRLKAAEHHLKALSAKDE